MNYRKLRMVLLEDVWSNWSDTQVQALFTKVVSLKAAGYGGLHRHGLLPVSDLDFIAIHKMICEERDGELFPLIANHTTTVARARFHNLPYPAFSYCNYAGTQQHRDVMEKIIASCDSEKRILGFDAGWTITPEARKDKMLAITLHRSWDAMKAFFIRDGYVDELLTAGTVRFNVERMCLFWGYKALEQNGERLSELRSTRFDGERVVMLHMKNLDPEALRKSAELEGMWADRITLGSRLSDKIPLAA